MIEDARRHAPAAARNRDPILAVLRDVLPPSGLVLEVASGTGEHAVHFSRALPALSWQPSDPDAGARASVTAWREGEDLPNLLAPLELDAAAPQWPVGQADAIVCINMIHISPWESTEGLMAGAGRLLPSGHPLVLYGPYRRAGHPIEASNQAFDEDLRRRDPRWGLRNLEDVSACAQARGLALERVVEMPANNLCVVFRKG
ncbi:class I SAM-dependent methyltransferase [Novosphingobium mangrovi (ex Huang et al. 2023)]|uniref:Class I SAM-dependent methyltransferase n=1 Tax=Novosphingobium mangrovi (ex Huang et al. 2023) TaxID=2976432 RepID=A0ABT2I4S4_9SPHN|nr:class I SAM-dependent methyltransferase [Novosphingobium mangrovi (ex Huang et al. 2023)]MCT2399812.1 class I SAM-dependent methyltransferase [Novosphingobium mangrovi (ex Huang et al. 2023)]